MSKLWIGKKLYSVENEVRDYCEELEAHIKLLSPYADHLPHCQGMVDSFTLDCNCGLDKALKGE